MEPVGIQQKKAMPLQARKNRPNKTLPIQISINKQKSEREVRDELVQSRIKKYKSLLLKQAFVGMAGFEPATSWSQTRRDTGLRYIPNFLAVREGFEPSVQFNPYDGLANRSFRPLRHLTPFGKCANIVFVWKIKNMIKHIIA